MSNSSIANKQTQPISALIVEGGAMRSVFSAGLLDGFLARQFNPFDMVVGVSAGANNLAAYLAGMPGKSLEIYTDLALRKEFISRRRFFTGGHFIDLDWLSNMTFSKGHIDLQSVYLNNRSFFVVVTDVVTGKAKYIKTDADNLALTIKASASLPMLYRGFPLYENNPVTDGGVADGIPVQWVIEQGACHIMVIRSRQQNYIKKDSMFHKYIRWHLRDRHKLVDTMKKRVDLFAKSLAVIQNPPPGINIAEICPPESFSIGRFCRSKEQLNDGYRMGYELSDKAIELWKKVVV